MPSLCIIIFPLLSVWKILERYGVGPNLVKQVWHTLSCSLLSL